jgi:hypothetical protein
LSAPATDATPSSGGGTSKTTTGAAQQTSPSLNPPSTPGGGGKELQDCMNFWDRGTHMSKAQWRAACKRTLNRIETLKVETDTQTSKQAADRRRKR